MMDAAKCYIDSFDQEFRVFKAAKAANVRRYCCDC